MSPSLEQAEIGAGGSRRVPRFVSCLVKGPLGCLAFVLGAAAVFVLLLPAALGRVLDRTFEREFAQRYAGQLELGDAWLGSFYGEQRVERLILRDPEGDEVLRGTLRAPALAELFDERSHHFGPIELRIELLHLVESADGTTNLERALEETGEREDQVSEGGFSTDMPSRFSLELTVARLRTTNAHGRATELANLAFNGTLEWGPEETRLVLEGGSDPGSAEPLRLRVEVARPEFGRRRRWSGELALDGVPSALARSLCAPVRPLSSMAGARMDRVNCSSDGGELTLVLEDEGARFELAGTETDGIVSGAAERAVRASLPCANAPGAALLAALLPLVTAFECLDPGEVHELRLTDYRWPLDGDWSQLAGELELVLAPAQCALVPLPSGLSGELLPSGARTLRMRVRDGVLECAQLDYTLDQGWLRVDGTLELASGNTALSVGGEYGGEPLAPVRLVGLRDALFPGLPETPLPPEIPADGVPSPPGQGG